MQERPSLALTLGMPLALLVLAGVLFGTSLLTPGGPAGAQLPPTPMPYYCGGVSGPGGRTIAYESVLVTPPIGHVYSWVGGSRETPNVIIICIVDFASTVVIDTRTALEIQRYVNDPRAEPVIDAIVASARLNPMPTPALFLTPPAPPTPDPTPRCPSGATGGPLFAYGAIVVEFPTGYVYSVGGQSDPVRGWTSLTVCVLQYNSLIVLDAQTGHELQRLVNDARAAPILDEIARRVTINPMPTPHAFVTPPSGPPAPVRRGLPIQPPATGDAALAP